MTKRACLHPAEWRKEGECDTCRFRGALEQIMMMTVGSYNPTTREGKMVERAAEIAGYALYPELGKKAKAE